MKLPWKSTAPDVEAWKAKMIKQDRLTRRAAHASLLGYCLSGVPPSLREEQRRHAQHACGELYVTSFYNGDAARCAEDNAFYVDGAPWL